ncbi:hypothetical protein KCU88_g109, partial [Aureobasidium melanogenum]
MAPAGKNVPSGRVTGSDVCFSSKGTELEPEAGSGSGSLRMSHQSIERPSQRLGRSISPGRQKVQSGVRDHLRVSSSFTRLSKAARDRRLRALATIWRPKRFTSANEARSSVPPQRNSVSRHSGFWNRSPILSDAWSKALLNGEEADISIYRVSKLEDCQM